MFKAAIFDFDGVLVDSDSHYRDAQINAFKSFGIELSESELQSARGRNTSEFVKECLLVKGEEQSNAIAISKLIDDYFVDTSYTPLFFKGVNDAMTLFEDREIKIAICSSSPLSTIKSALKSVGIENKVAIIVAAEHQVETKPSPEPFLRTSALLNVAPELCLVFEDSLAGLQSAHDAGMTVVHVDTASLPREITGQYLNERIRSISELTHKLIDNIWRLHGAEKMCNKDLEVNEFNSLLALYNNKQQWVRHYETLLAQITPLSTTVSLGIIAFVAKTQAGAGVEKFSLIIPGTLILFTIWFNWWCDHEIRRQFQQIVLAEKGLGFYNRWVDGELVLPKEYKDSPIKTRPIIFAGYILQFVSTAVLLFVGLSI